MRILLTVHQFLPHYQAGTEVLTLQTAQELVRRGHEVEIWAAEPVSSQNACKNVVSTGQCEGLRVHYFNHNPQVVATEQNVIEAEYDNQAFASIFNEQALRFHPDVVHFFHLSRLGALPIFQCDERQIPTVFTATDFWMICPFGQLVLPNHTLCEGPDPKSLNCLRHWLAARGLGWKAGIARYVPGAAQLLKKASRIPFLRGIQSVDFAYAAERRACFLRDALNSVDRVITPTQFVFDTLVSHGLNSDRVRRLRYGLRLDRPEQGHGKSQSQHLRFAFIGTLNELKGAHVAIQAVQRIPRHIPVRLTLYGNQAEFPAYVEKLRRLSDEDPRITFANTFPNARIYDIFKDIDALIVPSLWWENGPLVILSAKASQTPVIGTDVPGISELVQHERNGLLFPRGDDRALAELLNRCLREPGLLPHLGAEAPKVRTIEEYVEDLIQIYEELRFEYQGAGRSVVCHPEKLAA